MRRYGDSNCSTIRQSRPQPVEVLTPETTDATTTNMGNELPQLITNPARFVLSDTFVKFSVGCSKVFVTTTIIKRPVVFVAAIGHIPDEGEPIGHTATAIGHRVIPFRWVWILLCHLAPGVVNT